MNVAEFQEICRYIGFDQPAADRVASLAPHVLPHAQRIVEAFYELLEADPKARAVFTGGQEQMQRQRESLHGWLRELFIGEYDETYFRNRLRIGRAHLRVGLPQHYMIAGMHVLRRELMSVLRESGIDHESDHARALAKLLSVELAVMLGSYKETHTRRIREHEREAVEAKLTRAEHLAELGQLAVSLAHEIKNPLAGISGAIQIIRESLGSEHEHARIMDEMLAQIIRLDDVVKDLLLYARPSDPRFESCNLDDVIQSTLMFIRKESAANGVHISYHPNGNAAIVQADPAKMGQLLLNLTINAVDACEHGGEVAIALESSDHSMCVTIRDTGQGMDDETRERVFEPFYTRKPKGTGLGLSICSSIVESHGGEIRLESTPGKGTTVIIELPLEQERPLPL